MCRGYYIRQTSIFPDEFRKTDLCLGFARSASYSTEVWQFRKQDIPAIARTFFKHPEIAKDIVKRAGRYNSCLRRLKQYEKEGKVIVIRPDSTKGFSRMEKDKDKIKALYNDGYAKGLAIGNKIKEFFTEDQPEFF